MTTWRGSLAGVIAVLVLATGLRAVWLTADPPTAHPVGVVWHDEGAWVHNARNEALWDVWRTDEWNPMFIAPVFTALEAAAFETFGVGTWQARMVPLASGVLALAALMWGLWTVAGRHAALFGGLLLATSYTTVMWNRAALMESTMTMFIVMGWAAYAHASRRPIWGAAAGAAVVLAFFTKAAAAFFVAALVLELATAWWLSRSSRISATSGTSAIASTVLGLLAVSLVALLLFVLPNWTEFRFYNWQMTVTRKTEYSFAAFKDRATWLPLAHGVFSRMWLVLLAAAVVSAGIVARWRSAHPAERLAVLWVLVGLLELLMHDSGNERRYVMFVPGLVALAAMRFGARAAHDAGGPPAGSPSRHVRWLAVPVVCVLAYLVIASGVRLLLLDQVLAGDYSMTVRLSAALAVLVASGVWGQWDTWGPALVRFRLPATAAALIAVVTCATDLTLYGLWARQRTFLNYEASRAVGSLVPPGTLVQGKLANGLALENRIRPLFVGQGFGNFADRLSRDDARYILTYTQPRLGYEGPVILDVLQHYSGRRVIAEFGVDETPGPDRAALIDKFPDGPDRRARNQ